MMMAKAAEMEIDLQERYDYGEKEKEQGLHLLG
jgi:hypothetical protein